MKYRWTLLLLSMTVSLLIPVSRRCTAGERSNRTDHELEVAVHYDFFVIDGEKKVASQDPRKIIAEIQNGEIVRGRRKPAVKLNGNGQILIAASPSDLDPAQKAFSVGALCQPGAADGVLVAMGTRQDGFALYLKEGRPHFAVSSAAKTTIVVGEEPIPIDQSVHLMGTLDGNGQMNLVINGWSVAAARGNLIARTPDQPLSIGTASDPTYVDNPSLPNWSGLLEDIRLYWGVVDRNQHRDELGDWADLPGCGCK